MSTSFAEELASRADGQGPASGSRAPATTRRPMPSAAHEMHEGPPSVGRDL